MIGNVFRSLALMALFASPLAFADGKLDATFGDGGRVVTNMGWAAYPPYVASFYGTQGMALQPDGRIVMVGLGSPDGEHGSEELVRVKPDGLLDRTFNGTGASFIDGPAPIGFGVQRLALQPDGRVVLARISGTGVMVTRLTAAGAVDPTFNGGTSQIIELRRAADGTHNLVGSLQGVAIRGDGRIEVVASTTDPGLATYSFRLRFTPAGTLDGTLNAGGPALLPLSAAAMALQADDRLVIGGASNGAPALARLLDDDSLDATFNSGAPAGVPATNVGAVLVQPDGRIVVGGSAVGSSNAGFARFNADGTLDGSFNGTGTNVQGGAAASAVAVLAWDASTGRIVAAGRSSQSSYDVTLIRLAGDGLLDPTFNGIGSRSVPLSRGYMNTVMNFSGMTVQPDGAILYTGSGGNIFWVQRLLPGGSDDPSFGTNGVAIVHATPATDDTAFAVAVQPDGRIVAAGNTSWHTFTRNDALAIVRYLPDGSVDPAFSPQVWAGNGLTPQCSGYSGPPPSGCQLTALAMIVQGNGDIVTAGNWTGYAFTANGQRPPAPFSTFALFRSNASGTSALMWSAVLDDFSVARALVQQSDGKLVAAGDTRHTGGPARFAIARFNADSTADASFGTNGMLSFTVGAGESGANAVLQQPDGRLVAAGYSIGAGRDMAAVSLDANGNLTATFTLDANAGADDTAYVLTRTPDGRLLMAGAAGAKAALVKFSFETGRDTAFGNAGVVLVDAAPIRSVQVQPDGKIVALTGAFEVLRFLPNGALDSTFGNGGRMAIDMGASAAAFALALQPDGRYVVAGAGGPNADHDFALARIDPAAPAIASVSPQPVDFGGVTLFTASTAFAVTITNRTGTPLVANGVSDPPAPFARTGDCTGTLAPGGTCTLAFTFSPTAVGAFSATATLGTSAGPVTISMRGTGERSLVTHYYVSILGRMPDAGGKAFWDSEAARMQALGVSVGETWNAMAMAIFSSAEYVGLHHDDTQFVRDLYLAFFNRQADPDGLAYWTSQLGNGLPREVALASFMFSEEFANFVSAAFGQTGMRAEVGMVVDFYRGILGRLPDTNGLQAWVGFFRDAQCQGGNAVYAQVEEISRSFLLSFEASQRKRTDAQFVGDMYNAFLRRGGDLGGVAYWIGQVSSGARTRDQVRQAFKSSSEFTARVNGVIALGCSP